MFVIKDSYINGWFIIRIPDDPYFNTKDKYKNIYIYNFAGIDEDSIITYLYLDLTLKTSCYISETYNGYYKSKEEAQETLDRYNNISNI